MAAAPPIAQGDPLGARVATAAGLALAPGNQRALSRNGSSLAVEAAAVIPGGSAHVWEAGVRGEARSAPSAHEITAFAGVRVALSEDDASETLLPIIRGGLRAGHAREASGGAPVFGPYLALGVERSPWRHVRVSAEVVAHATMAPPLRATIALQLAIAIF